MSSAICSMCHQEIVEETGKETPEADSYCVDCKYFFCQECGREHKKFKSTRNHTLIPRSEYERGQHMALDLASMVCEVHEQKVLNVFCADCKTVICATCFIEKHKDHKGSDVNNCVDDFRKQIENKTEAMIECIDKCSVEKGGTCDGEGRNAAKGGKFRL